ncbi:efflux RND transporter permease subunit [Candidatus Sulfurimonas baltica]|uniref:MMPL family transporter n=1 Tax=Candidatus Sulfurimonas baltica TaxID=2740404 RepID=A0A7S7LWM1_9BACT|nr:MMPL family transporter [Candidatus Sulfurimonas baltica]QOY52884.1 MMPL family transporter [Candidatus Sulfurimonas baltica]
MLTSLYKNYLLKYPKVILLFMAVFVAIMALFAIKLEIDASAETLLLEGDKDLKYSREVSKRFKAPDFLVVTYSVEDDLLSDENINNIKLLSSQIKTLKIVESINSIVNVPLLQSPVRPVKELMKDIPTLESPNMDKALAKQEFLNSAIYKQNLVSEDFKTTALSVNLKRDEKYFNLIDDRDKFIKLKKQKVLTKAENENFKNASQELKNYRDIVREENHQSIVKIRDILTAFESKNKNVKLHLGGVDMIADDMVEFVKYDLKTFGFLIIGLLIVILYILLKKVQWVVIALFICTVSLIVTSGFLGLFGWEITVVSSNYISLQLIMNMSLVVHLIVRYKELNLENSNHTQMELALNTVLSMAKPSFFVVITTIAGFSSLVFSNILPVINFGWMMSVGIVVSLLMTFILFPIVLILFEKYKIQKSNQVEIPFTSKIAHVAYYHKKTVLIITLAIVAFSVTGASKLRVENSFIDYFKKDTQIYKGMVVIDQNLGGTTPLDVILTFKESSDEVKSVSINTKDSDIELDEFAGEFAESEEDKEQYWFTQSKMQKIREVHNYLDALEPIGKVLSLSTMGEVIKTLNDGKEADGVTLALLYKELPEKYKKIILSPYIDIENNQVRISTRIIDSMPNLQRDELIKKIDKDLNTMLNPKYEEHKVSNLLVMYNNMLQSLFESQIKTIGIVVVILFFMFLMLFKSLKIATIAIIANTIPVSVIFGFMGWMDIPLDMMTITIAAISIGIAVDDTIHYIYRYSLEYRETSNAKLSMFNSHASIGTAMFYTTTIIMTGFSILVLSNFIPTIYFGLLTMLAMFMAIVADLMLLPVLLLLFGI